MRMRSILAAIAIASLGVAVGAAGETKTQETREPKSCVALAKSWAEAVKEAKALNMPMVVHSHGFYCGPCWGMHASVMCDPGYIEFAYENTVEVISLDRLQEGVTKKEEHAATYDVKEGKKTVQYLVEFPGMTVDDMLALRTSKASSYNKSGAIPYASVVDPFTEEEMKAFKGATPVADITTAVTEARKTLAKAHGKSKPRKDVAALADADTVSKERIAAGDFAGAIDAYAKASAKIEKAPQFLRDRVAKAKEAVVTSATEALDKIEAAKADDAAKAKKDLSTLLSHLRGTGLEERAKTLLATL